MIHFEEVTKKFGNKTVLDNLSLSVSTRQVTAILGPNGSGKSTLMKLILQAIRPDKGLVRWESGNREYTGYLPETQDFPSYFRAGDIIRHQGVLLNLTRSEVEKEVSVSSFRISDFKEKKITALSKGMKKKLGLTRAFLGKPRCILLDEPFEGIDTIDRDKLINLINRSRENHTGVILSSHILFELETICDRVIFLKDGRAVLSMDLNQGNYVLVKNKNNGKSIFHDLVSQIPAPYVLNDNSFIVNAGQLPDTMSLPENSFVKHGLVNEIYKCLYQ